MPTLATVVGLGAMVAGYAALGWGLATWETADAASFVGYLVLATGAAAVQIAPTTSRATLSPHLFFLLLCISRFSFGEVIVIAAMGAIPQAMLWSRDRKTSLPTAMDVGALLTAAAAAFWIARAVEGAPGELRNPALEPLVLVLAGAGYALVKTLLDEIAAPSEGMRFGEAWRKHHFWTLPHYAISGAAAGLADLAGSGSGWTAGLMVLPLLAWMFYSYRNHLTSVDEQRQHVRDLNALHFRTIETLALAIEAHDPTKRGHLLRLGIYVRDLGARMGLKQPQMEALHAASLLHDIGKMAVPRHIISKPGQLTQEEFERVKIHVEAGAEILEQVQFPYPVVPIVRAHHEKWDGSGYPAGLKGEQIPLGARILAVVDCLDALISDRNHRPAATLPTAIDYIRSQSGKSFDPAVVELLVLRYRDLESRVSAAESAPSPRISTLDDPPLLAAAAGSGVGGAATPGTFLRRIAAAKEEELQLFQLIRELGNSLSLHETLEVCAGHLMKICPADTVAISIRHGEILTVEHAAGADSDSLQGRQFRLESGVTGSVARSGKAVLNGDPSNDFRALSGGSSGSKGAAQGPAGMSASRCPEFEARSVLAVPLESPTGLIGVITLYANQADGFDIDHLRVLGMVAGKVALAVENALRYSQVERSATTDNLTGLPNARSLFLHLDAELARARRQDLSVAALVCDLDGFKAVNDELGHMEGNRVLREVALALKQQCREYDFVGRMGGDEFVVVLSGYRYGALQPKIDQLMQAVERAGEDMGISGLGVSIGAGCYPDDGEDAESLLAEADQRMYAFKRQRADRLADAVDPDFKRLRRTLDAQDLLQ